MFKIIRKSQLGLCYLRQFCDLNFNRAESVLINQSRNFGLTARNFEKLFRDVENNYAYSILKTMPVIKTEDCKVSASAVSNLEQFNLLLDQNFRWKSPKDVIQTFKDVQDFCKSNNINVSDHRFDKLVDGLAEHSEYLTMEDISELLVCLSRFPQTDSFNSHNFHDIWSALDDMCLAKIGRLDTDDLFKFADHWYRLHLGKQCDFVFNCVDRLSRNPSKLTKSQLLHLFYYMSLHRSRKILFSYQDALEKIVNKMNVDELAVAALAYSKTSTLIRPKKITEVIMKTVVEKCATIDDVALGLFAKIRFDRLLVSGRVSKFVKRCLERLRTNAGKLSRGQLVRVFFLVNVVRTSGVYPEFERALEKEIYSLTVDELAVAAMGFFKSQSAMGSRLVASTMIWKVKQDVRDIHDISLSAILKVLRYRPTLALTDQILDLLDHITPEIGRLSITSCLHIALLGTGSQIFHEPSLKAVSQKLVDNIADVQKVRLKDMERLLLPLTTFNFDPQTKPDIYEAILTQLHSKEREFELVKYPRCIACALNYLSIRNIRSYELMNRILDMEFIVATYGKYPKMLAREVVVLDSYIEIECPYYTGTRLDPAFKLKAMKWSLEYSPQNLDPDKKLSVADKLILDTIETASQLTGNKDFVCVKHVLPHFSRVDVVVCKDRAANEFVRPQGFDGYKLGDIMKPPQHPNLIWYAFVVLGMNNTTRNTIEPVGAMEMKRRQLKILGYEPIFIKWNEFITLNAEDKLNYIKNKLL